MPAVQSGTVLVTGGSGFIGAHVVRTLLIEGFHVKTTVRSTEKGEYLKKKLSDISGGGGQLEYDIVEDIEAPNAFDEAVKGVDAILHTASPFHFNSDDPNELIGPAVEGTLNCLRSAHKFNKDVKRIVVTSSVASVMTPRDTPTTFTEEDWNTHSPKEIEEKGKDASRLDFYMASKTLAERAAWKFVEEVKPSFDLATVEPPLVLGPCIHEIPTKEKLNTSIARFYELFSGVLKDATPEKLVEPMSNIVDVRDVANTHLLALTFPSASGQRFITASDRGMVTNQDFVDALHSRLGDNEAVKKNVPIGEPNAGKKINRHRFSNDKAKNTLKQTFFSQEQTAVDTFLSLQEYEKQWN
ncbi:D-lactaldehyde dehydrogenase [Wallemia mellicola CBS 633.66]|uniref:D-lactaldehyde dehydrogenase n=1 Tax=Wallemia mellicola (strain ATCC MYA-4683 / CBS 633.66) TaxID=671144 RepID=I4YE85_WALMC|nr:D-lactaldehyde dehydrogenase [Wallemia mellicola CBS 633.66]EIM22277.1 D-lactaldehyde dehydrogenase [Wallemia mellicola CBS 633.66]TIB93289.1 D-lactaldehyde dehydrogenase [Wallemia mellicola]TIC28374.1 D-lactaldehyde dehydrogenase [Wallemia mellicola]TIC74106.1 D-lactaldehyde dehydrogenase [Wallemia mellicola]|eukprot:XP_006957539.1 D-lactaldehyde dehydrogenase [Wallemia mellicola CBS 633.66]